MMNLDFSFVDMALLHGFVWKGLRFSVMLTLVATLGGLALGTLLIPWDYLPALDPAYTWLAEALVSLGLVLTGAALAVTVYSGIMYIVDGMRISKELDAQADGADQAPGEGEGASDEDGGPSEQDEDGQGRNGGGGGSHEGSFRKVGRSGSGPGPDHLVVVSVASFHAEDHERRAPPRAPSRTPSEPSSAPATGTRLRVRRAVTRRSSGSAEAAVPPSAFPTPSDSATKETCTDRPDAAARA